MKKSDAIQYLKDIHLDVRSAIESGDMDLIDKHIERLARQRDERFVLEKLFELFALTPLSKIRSAIARMWFSDLSEWGGGLEHRLGAHQDTMLLYAARNHRWAVVSKLLDMGCNPELKDSGGYSSKDFVASTTIGDRPLSFRGDYELQDLRERLLLTPQSLAREEKRILADSIDYELAAEETQPRARTPKRL